VWFGYISTAQRQRFGSIVVYEFIRPAATLEPDLATR
jgi:hypothetical protein